VHDAADAYFAQQFESNGKDAFLQVFQPVAVPRAWAYYPDPFGEPFTAAITQRCVLYPVLFDAGYPWRLAIAIAAATVGDVAVFRTDTEHARGRSWHLYTQLTDQDTGFPYKSAESMVEYALYSPAGSWGVLVSHESHAVAGGSARFIATLAANLTQPLAQQLDAFLREWKWRQTEWKSQLDWLPQLLRHLYGAERAAALLIQYEIVA